MNRLEYIESHVREEMEDTVLDTVELVSLDDWPARAFADPGKHHHPYGYLAPERIDDDHWRFVLCPELIVGQTVELEDDEFTVYVGTITYHAHKHVDMEGLATRYSPDQFEAFLESFVTDIAPSIGDLIRDVRAAVTIA